MQKTTTHNFSDAKFHSLPVEFCFSGRRADSVAARDGQVLSAAERQIVQSLFQRLLHVDALGLDLQIALRETLLLRTHSAQADIKFPLGLHLTLSGRQLAQQIGRADCIHFFFRSLPWRSHFCLSV
jgi:hypothetical protein